METPNRSSALSAAVDSQARRPVVIAVDTPNRQLVDLIGFMARGALLQLLVGQATTIRSIHRIQQQQNRLPLVVAWVARMTITNAERGIGRNYSNWPVKVSPIAFTALSKLFRRILHRGGLGGRSR